MYKGIGLVTCCLTGWMMVVDCSPVRSGCSICIFPCVADDNSLDNRGCRRCLCPPRRFPWGRFGSVKTDRQANHRQRIGASISVGPAQFPEQLCSPCKSPCIRLKNSGEDATAPCGRCSCPDIAPPNDSLPPLVPPPRNNLPPLVLDYSPCPDSPPCPGYCPVAVDEQGCQICGCPSSGWSQRHPKIPKAGSGF